MKLTETAIKTIYYEKDDILVIRVSDKAITRETSQDWHTTISYAADGSIAELVLLEARARGAFPVQQQVA